jgi:hypothetical protein
MSKPQCSFQDREYLRLANTNLEDRAAVIRAYPDGEAVWEDLRRYEIAQHLYFRRVGRMRSLRRMTLREWEADERRGPRLTYPVHTEQVMEAGKRLYRRHLLRNPPSSPEDLEQHVFAFTQVYSLMSRRLTNIAGEVAFTRAHVRAILQAIVDEHPINPPNLDFFASRLKRIGVRSQLVVERRSEQVPNTIRYGMGDIRQERFIEPLFPSLSGFGAHFTEALLHLAEDLEQGIPFARCRFCENRDFFVLKPKNRQRCATCPPNMPTYCWKKQNPEAVKQHQRDARTHRRNHQRREGDRLRLGPSYPNLSRGGKG